MVCLVALGAATPSSATQWPGSWPRPVSVAPGLGLLSCASPNFCVAAATRTPQLVMFNGHSWSAPQTLPTAGPPYSISCPSSNFCMLVAGPWSVLTYDGTAWCTGPRPSQTLVDASCVSANFCMAADDEGDTLTHNGSAWSTPQPTANGINQISCASSSLCIARTFSDAPIIYRGNSWRIQPIPHEPVATEAVTCASADFCEAVDAIGGLYAYTDGSWVPFGYALPAAGGQHSLSCASLFMCAVSMPVDGVATDAGVNRTGVGYFELPKRTAVRQKPLYLTVSCVSSFCAAVSRSGLASTYTSPPLGTVLKFLIRGALLQIASYEDATLLPPPYINPVVASVRPDRLAERAKCLNPNTLGSITQDSSGLTETTCRIDGRSYVYRTAKRQLGTTLAPFRNYKPLLTVLGDAAAMVANASGSHGETTSAYATRVELRVRYARGGPGELKELDFSVHHGRLAVRVSRF
jgi:hypothetical protein